jgi:hypothetical protein
MRFTPALRLLKAARAYAEAEGRCLWDFAVEIDSLRSAGLSSSDLRLLTCRGLVEHAAETAGHGKEDRVFRGHGLLTFTRRTCFILTDAGAAVATGLDLGGPPRVPLPPARASLLPRWHGGRRELWLGEALVKRFRVPADNQELILAAFEEEAWPPRLDDPLPPKGDLNPKRRLAEAIHRLNGCQRQPLLHFFGDGHGSGICWEVVL